VKPAPVKRFRGLRVLTQEQKDILNTKDKEIYSSCCNKAVF